MALPLASSAPRNCASVTELRRRKRLLAVWHSFNQSNSRSDFEMKKFDFNITVCSLRKGALFISDV